MSITKTIEYFKQFNIHDNILEFDVSSATVELASIALNVPEGKIAKTLSFIVGENPILVVVAGDMKIDNSKYKAQFKAKAKMISFDQTEQIIGHAAGGVCPFGINDSVNVYLDVSLKNYDTLYPACGSANSAIQLTPDEIEKYAQNFVSWIDVCKNKES